jgi:hypothetical protein
MRHKQVLGETAKGSRLLVEMVILEGTRVPFLHSEVDQDTWSHTEYKECLKVFEECTTDLKDEGFDDVYVCIDVLDDLLMKWEEMFGFTTVYTDTNHRLMWKEV